MAISGSISIEGLEITGSYTKLDTFNYNKTKSGDYSITYSYSIYVDENHRKSGRPSLLRDNKNFSFTTETPLDLFYWIYNNIKAQPYFQSGSFVDV
jgi:hypothetical protein